ncbi:hypothetical protein BpHYR1_019508 [Brachionus plicatilis]|uniref:Uncharacterized protein n=1 Tax=Brachionus plicatilis TaxID=10195 RepID=A0A3M7SJX2_BRAPC|nr:hypothetical protein BpHYR1_019508 [Brachionus plicatilis]
MQERIKLQKKFIDFYKKNNRLLKLKIPKSLKFSRHSCIKYWLRNYKCSSNSNRISKKRCNFDSVRMDIPIQSNQSSNAVPKSIESDESKEEEYVPKRARIELNNQEIIDKETKSCDLCGAPMKKKRYWACR